MFSAATWPTPRPTLEAVMYCVRERGLSALNEPANQQRLLTCDATARSQINDRIDKLITAGRLLTKEKVDA